MVPTFLFATAGAVALPGYALGQPIEDARIVVPVGMSREQWHLRCAGEPQAPKGLEVSSREKAAGVLRCWTIEVVGGVERRTAAPRRGAHHSTQEIEFLNGKIVRITTVYYYSASDSVGRSFVWSKPEATKIDELAA